MSRNLRPRPRISYYEIEEPNLDEYVFCDNCRDYVYEYCSIHGPLLVIPDDTVPSPTGMPSFVHRAALTIPQDFLHLAPSNIPGAGIGVFATLTLPKGVRFGPYRGVRVKQPDSESEYCWQIYDSSNRRPVYAVDGRDPERSNWMRYVNCSRHWFEQNLLAYQYQGELYYRTIKIIPRFTELLVFYGAEFANSLRINLKFYNSSQGLALLYGPPEDQKATSKNKEQSQTQTPEKNPIAAKTTFNTNKNILETNTPSTSKTFHNNVNDVELETPKAVNTIENPEENMNLNENTYNVPDHTPDPDTSKIPNKSFFTAKKAYSCDICEYKTSNVNVLNNHLKAHAALKRFQCDMCLYMTIRKDRLIAHLNTHTKEKQLSNSKMHQRIQIYARPLSCDVCHLKFTNGFSLNNHLKIHSKERPYACDECHSRFTKGSLLKRHMIIHTGERPYACDECHSRFTNGSSLKRHMRTHTGEKPYGCDVCHSKFTQGGDLKRHMKIHTGEKPYTCDVCHSKFNQGSKLKTHMRIHTAEKPYNCDVCQSRFSTGSYLKTHMRIHTGEKPYACNVCQSRFSDGRNFRSHMRIHTGEKPYACDICHSKFAHSSSLKRHLKAHKGKRLRKGD